MLDIARKLAEKRGYQVEGLAPSLKAVAALQDAVPKAATIESALTKYENGLKGGDKSKTILVVDEASMLSSQNMNRVLSMAQEQGYARVALVGDVKQLDAVGAGSAFRVLQDAGMKTAHMTDIQRQRTEEGRDAVVASIGGDIKRAMDGIKEIVVTGGMDEGVRAQHAELLKSLMKEAREERQRETGSQNVPALSKEDYVDLSRKAADMLERGGSGANGTGFKTVAERRAEIALKVAETYLEQDGDERARTGVIALTNEMRSEISRHIQVGLINQGVLSGTATTISGLVPQGFTEAETREARSYETGDIVVAMVAKPNSRLTAGTLYTITDINKEKETLTLNGEDGKTVTLDLTYASKPTEKLAVFTRGEETFHAGDKIQFKITDRDHGVENASEGMVKAISKESVTIAREGGKDLTIPTDSLSAKGMQLAYASTAHNFQGSTVDRVVLGMVSAEQLADQKSFYVALSRMREDTVLVTDDPEKLTATIEKQTGERVGALQALAEEKARKEAEKSDGFDREKLGDTQAEKQREIQTEKQAEKAPEKDTSDARIKEIKTALSNFEKYGGETKEQGELFERLERQLKDQKTLGEREL